MNMIFFNILQPSWWHGFGGWGDKDVPGASIGGDFFLFLMYAALFYAFITHYKISIYHGKTKTHNN